MPADSLDRPRHAEVARTRIVHDDPDSTLGWCDDQAEFGFGIDFILDDFILDGLGRLRQR